MDASKKSALYADDRAMWMRARNVSYVVENIKKALEKVKKWSHELTVHGQPMERVSEFKYLGLWLDSEYTWKIHIKHLETSCAWMQRGQIIDIYRVIMS